MILANLVGPQLIQNRIFDLTDPANRDNCFEPYAQLREAFLRHEIEINTSDVNAGQSVDFELHQDVRSHAQTGAVYLMLFETPVVYPNNWNTDAWTPYRKIFTWDDDLADGNRFIKFNFPNPITVPAVTGFAGRERFCCMIAGNKAATKFDLRELYSERVRVIRWFETNAPRDFDLYGVDWDLPPCRPGMIGKIIKRMWRYGSKWIRLVPFPSYRGKVDHKRDVLNNTRFAIAYENVRDLPGYITEKIFDCFFSGCVPVYWGSSTITDVSPADCFIDRRNFADTASVYAHLKAMDEATYIGYQQRIVTFLQSDAVYPFSSACFAKTIVETIVSDLER
jgi:hypothetical protein